MAYNPYSQSLASGRKDAQEFDDLYDAVQSVRLQDPTQTENIFYTESMQPDGPAHTSTAPVQALTGGFAPSGRFDGGVGGPAKTVSSQLAQAGHGMSLRHQAASIGPSNLAGTTPHYFATTTYAPNLAFRRIFYLSLISSFLYFAARIVYIALGWSELELPSNLDPTDETDADTIQNLIDNHTYSWWWSIIVLTAEVGGFVLVHVGQQMFTRQGTEFTPMVPASKSFITQLVDKKGHLMQINIMVCTYGEPMETVKNCIQHLLDAQAPVYAKKTIYIGDDGAGKTKKDASGNSIPDPHPEAFRKRDMAADFRADGHDVIWVGDRVKMPATQLNGKSSNINHMVLNRMYPHIKVTADIPLKDILMVMDCDHMVEPEFFAKCCAVMLDKNNAVCLVPQSFHNEVKPDCFDNTNYNFMFRLMPYYFGAGCCFVTGTNVMIRARAAFEACRFDENPHGGEGGSTHRQLFSETLVAEDIDLGSRVHCLGYRSIFLSEILAKGEVPLDARDIWKQRSRWAKAAHLYILDPHSVFWQKQPFMTFHQKSLYCIPMILHFTLVWAEPIMFTMPILCLAGDICPYGVDTILWTTHFFKLVTTMMMSTWADTWELSRSAVYAQTSSRVLFFVNVKAVLNTLMVKSGWKKAGAFKITAKAAAKPGPVGESTEHAVRRKVAGPVGEATSQDEDHSTVNRHFGRQPYLSGNGSTYDASFVREGDMQHSVAMEAEPTVRRDFSEAPEPFHISDIHKNLSQITNKRAKFMPFEGTLDFWVLLGITAMNLTAVGFGINSLQDGSIFSIRGDEQDNIKLIAVVFAFVEATPGLLFLMYMVCHGPRLQWVLKIWTPLVIGGISLICVLIEFRIGFQYFVTFFGLNWQLPDCEIGGKCSLNFVD